MKLQFKHLIFLSLAILAVTLYKANYLKVPQVSSYSVLVVSFIFLIGGFISHMFSWKQVLEKSGYDICSDECLAGTGISIFGKYISGKIWVIVGRAACIDEKNDDPLCELSAISLNAQFIALWLGRISGTIGLFLLGGFISGVGSSCSYGYKEYFGCKYGEEIP